jgi:hypothetical protein
MTATVNPRKDLTLLLREIQATFLEAKKHAVHKRKPDVRPVAVYSIVPNVESWPLS